MSNPQLEQQPPAANTTNTNGALIEAQSRLESQSTLESKRLAYPLLYNATPPTVLVDFDGNDDPYQPMNRPFRKKVITTILYGLTTCWITFASAIYSAGLEQVAEDLKVSTEVSASGISLIVFGFGLGPLVWAPLSDGEWAEMGGYTGESYLYNQYGYA